MAVYKFVYTLFWKCMYTSTLKEVYKFVQVYIPTCSLQVYTGKRRAAQPEADLSLVKIRDLVAIHCENYTKEPVIGECTRIEEDYIEVGWMEVSYTSSWKPWKIRDPKNKRRTVTWTDTVPKPQFCYLDLR